MIALSLLLDTPSSRSRMDELITRMGRTASSLGFAVFDTEGVLSLGAPMGAGSQEIIYGDCGPWLRSAAEEAFMLDGLGWLPATEIALWFKGSALQDQRRLGALALRLVLDLNAIIDFRGCLLNTRGGADIDFLRCWLGDPRFHLLEGAPWARPPTV